MGAVFSRCHPKKCHPKSKDGYYDNVETLADFEMPITKRAILHRKVSRYAGRACLDATTEIELEKLFYDRTDDRWQYLFQTVEALLTKH